MKTRFYYSLSDLYSNPATGPFSAISSNTTFASFFSRYSLPASAYSDTTQTITLWREHIWPRFYDEALFFIDVEHDEWTEPTKPAITSTEVQAKAQAVSGRIWSWIEGTRDRYEFLISTYGTQRNNLMSKLSTTSTALFNDTPQDGGTFTSSPYVTNATQTTINADSGTPMARLKEIDDNLNNLYRDWSNEFYKFVIL